MNPLDKWPVLDQLFFILDIVCVTMCLLIMIAHGFNLIGLLAILFCTMGGTGIFIKNNPGSIKG